MLPARSLVSFTNRPAQSHSAGWNNGKVPELYLRRGRFQSLMSNMLYSRCPRFYPQSLQAIDETAGHDSPSEYLHTKFTIFFPPQSALNNLCSWNGVFKQPKQLSINAEQQTFCRVISVHCILPDAETGSL
jgi:hypothetical protein